MLAEHDLLDVSRVVLDSAHVPAKKGGGGTGPSPVERGKPGSRMHVLSDRRKLPVVVALSPGNEHDSQGLRPVITALFARRETGCGWPGKPGKLHADTAYDQPELRRWVRGKRIGVRIARKGVESSERLGRHRRVIERTMSWLSGYRRLSPRYERDPDNHLGFLALAAAICCFKRPARHTI